MSDIDVRVRRVRSVLLYAPPCLFGIFSLWTYSSGGGLCLPVAFAAIALGALGASTAVETMRDDDAR